jgi:hypothetical protein
MTIGGRRCRQATKLDFEETVSTVARMEDSIDVVFDKEINIETEAASISTQTRKKNRKLSAAARATFEIRFIELLEFKEFHGHLMVPRRYGKLGDWVNKLRQRKHRLDQERLDRLNGIGFCWDASGDKRRKEREKWWERLESLPLSTVEQPKPGTCRMSPPSRGAIQRPQQLSILSFENLTNAQTKWLRRQRIQYIESGRNPSSKLDRTQIQALNAIDPNWWQTATERKWNDQYFALKNFKAKHGTWK